MRVREVRATAKVVNETARGKARIPRGVGAYVLRHARIGELLQIHGVDPLTVAHQTGTGLVMDDRAAVVEVHFARNAREARCCEGIRVKSEIPKCPRDRPCTAPWA